MGNVNKENNKIRYNTNLDRLQIGKNRVVKRLVKTVKNHKIISMAVISLIIFSTVNMVMIYQFMKILQNMWNCGKIILFWNKEDSSY